MHLLALQDSDHASTAHTTSAGGAAYATAAALTTASNQQHMCGVAHPTAQQVGLCSVCLLMQKPAQTAFQKGLLHPLLLLFLLMLMCLLMLMLDSLLLVYSLLLLAVLLLAAAACAHQVDDGHLVFTERLMCGPLHTRGEVYAPPTAEQQEVSVVPEVAECTAAQSSMLHKALQLCWWASTHVAKPAQEAHLSLQLLPLLPGSPSATMPQLLRPYDSMR